jgi:hypothetical protein
MRAIRRAEGYADNASRWAHYLGWTDTALSNYEVGFRRVPRDAALRLRERVPGLDPIWLWTGEEMGLPVGLRDRLREAERIERELSGKPDKAKVSRPISRDKR